jgi:RHS repeat-associated protein
MSGISDQAIKTQYAVNKYRFQKQELQNKEFSDGSGLEMYEFKYRMDDPQIGRFWSTDPLASKYVYNSPYAFSEDKVVNSVELEGLEATLAISWEYNQERAQAKAEGGQQGARDFDQGVATAGKVGVKLAEIPLAIAAPGIGIPVIVSDLSGVPVLPSPQAYASAVVEEGSQAVNLEQRAKDIQGALPDFTQTKTTTAVASATTAEGNGVTLVASSEKNLRLAQINVLQPGEIPVSGTGHAETTILNYASQNNMTVTSVAASRPICPSCAVAISNAGATAASPLKVVAPAAAAGNAPSAPLFVQTVR